MTKLKAVIVDDSPTERKRLREILEKLGHEVHEAEDGASGVALVKETLPHFVLMDVVMPGLNGFQSTRQITKSPDTEHIPVIMVTTKDQETDRIWGQRQGASGYITKPVDERLLIAEIARVTQAA